MRYLYLTFILLISIYNLVAQTYGCTDPLATNYNALATQNDGSCVYSPGTVSPFEGVILPAMLQETSGLIFWNQKIWTHNDDTDINIYAIDPGNDTDIQLYPLTGTVNNDWEEIAQDSNFIYIGDFGNNANGNRTNLKILMVEKQSLLENNPSIDTLSFKYSLQTDLNPQGPNNTNFDCESFIVSKDSIYLFTKEWISQKTSLYSLPKKPGTYTALFRDSYNTEGLITGATYLEAKRIVVLCGYTPLGQPFLLLLYDFGNYDFFKGNKRKISINASFHQIEGITTEDGLLYYISNEKFIQSFITTNPKLQKIDLSGFLNDYINSLSSDITNRKDSNDIRIYPNPAGNSLNIEYDNGFEGVGYSISDITGRIVNRGMFNSNSITINVQHFEAGLYFIYTDNKIRKQFVKR